MAARRQPCVVLSGRTTGLSRLTSNKSFPLLFPPHSGPSRQGCSPPASRTGIIPDKGRAPGSRGWVRCQRTQPVFGTLAYSPRWPAGAAIWPARDILFRITGPGSRPGSALGAGMTEVEPVCSDSTDLSDATTMEPQLSVAFTVPFQAGFQRTWLILRLRVGCWDLWFQSGWASIESNVMGVQWSMFIITANNNRNLLCTKELMSSWFIFCKPPHQRFPGDVII